MKLPRFRYLLAGTLTSALLFYITLALWVESHGDICGNPSDDRVKCSDAVTAVSAVAVWAMAAVLSLFAILTLIAFGRALIHSARSD